MEILAGVLMPSLLIGAGVYFGIKLRFFWLFHPVRTWRTLREAAQSGGTSPFAALTTALAGTLGVGNIAGVATAITAGGAGAVFWMLIGALAAMGVKYAEVYLAVRWRRTRTENNKTACCGGAMYYIRDGLARSDSAFLRQLAPFLGGGFALLCGINALLTGNIVQVRAAVSCTEMPPILFGMLFAAAALILSGWGMRRVAAASSVVIPTLAAVYILLCSVIIFAGRAEIPRIMGEIWAGAWDFRPAAGGFLGFGVSRAVRYGITRGIFSNEAGCGTSPTAHAAAHTRSPHHQGCFGIFEVFADTVLLCSMTALVILLYHDREGLDGIPLSLAAFSRQAAEIGGAWLGDAAGWILRISIILFAFATVVCQSCYGIEAVRYFTFRNNAVIAYRIVSAAAVIIGAVIPVGLMWVLAYAVVCVMTVVNVICLLILRREVKM